MSPIPRIVDIMTSYYIGPVRVWDFYVNVSRRREDVLTENIAMFPIQRKYIRLGGCRIFVYRFSIINRRARDYLLLFKVSSARDYQRFLY